MDSHDFPPALPLPRRADGDPVPARAIARALALLLLAAGCGDDGPATGDATGTGTGTTEATDTTTGTPPPDTSSSSGSTGLDETSSGGTTEGLFAFTEGPTFTLAPVPEAALAGRLDASTNMPSTITVHVGRDGSSFDVEYGDLSTEHSLTVLGLHQDTTHTLSVTATNEAGQTIEADLPDVITDPAHAEFPQLTTIVSNPAMMEPGVTVMGVADFIIMVDDSGEVEWTYHSDATRPLDIRRLDNGNLLVLYRSRLKINELDMLGNVVQEWHAANSTDGNPGSIPVAVDSFHHEVHPLPDGNLMTLSTELRDYDNYPTGELDPTPQLVPQTVVGDVVVVFQPDGTIVNEYSLLDIMDPYRIQYDSFGSYWDEFYGITGGADWSHANAVVPDPSDGGIVISTRNQDAVIKIDDTGSLVWILGTHDNWSMEYMPYLLEPVGAPFEWPWHQHAPEFMPNGNIMLFDNGNYRVSPPTSKPGTNYSRPVEFSIDEGAMQITQVWSYDAGQMLYAPAVGDADPMPTTDNVMAVYGVDATTLLEVTRDTQEVVFELDFVSPMYRAERLPSLYPCSIAVDPWQMIPCG